MHEYTAGQAHLQYKHVRLLRAERDDDVDAGAVVVVETVPLLVNRCGGLCGVCLCLELLGEPAVAKVELVLDVLVQPGLEDQGHRSTRQDAPS